MTSLDDSAAAADPKKPEDEIMEEEEDDGDSLFVVAPIHRKRKTSGRAGPGRKKIKIHILSMIPETPAASETASSSLPSTTLASDPDPSADDLILPLDSLTETLIPPNELEDTLAFFADTHEDQDPAFQQLERDARRKALQEKLDSLAQHDQTTRQEIDKFINEQLLAKQASTESSLEKYKLRFSQDETRDTQRLYQLFTQKSSGNLLKINQGMKALRDRHANELQSAMNHHRIQGQQRHTPPEQLAQEWHTLTSQLQQKQQRQLQEFANRSEDLKQKMSSEYKREQEKIRKQYEHKLASLQANRNKIFEKMATSFQQIRQRYMKKHMMKLQKQREDLQAEIDALDNPTTAVDTKTVRPESSSTDPHHESRSDRLEFRQPIPIQSTQPWASGKQSGAAARHKHRKTTMSQTPRQLFVELHNEGLWLSVVRPKDASEKALDDKTVKTDDQFIAWSVRARTVLYSIACGEIPADIKQFDFGEVAELQSGQVRCVVTDLRTSEESATALRAQCMQEQDQEHLMELKKRAEALVSMASDAEKQSMAVAEEEKESIAAMDAAKKDIDKYKRAQEEFRRKFRQYFGPDGKVNASNPNDRQKLENALNDMMTKLAHAEEKEKASRQRAVEAKLKREKVSQTLKVAQRNVVLITNTIKQRQVILSGRATQKQMEAFAAERSGSRVKDVIGALKKVADHRRERMNEKKSNSASMSWLQAFPGLPSSLTKSLWHKMHRRKHQIILRPTNESILNELRTKVKENVDAGAKIPQRNFEDELRKAEQLLLLATHPVAEENLPSVPGTRSDHNWAEPGCRLDLSVGPSVSSDRILPCRPFYPVLEKNLSEIASAPGRQAASLLRTPLFKCLASPLSTCATASSFAEAGAVPQAKKVQSKDPFITSESDMREAYTFSLRQQPAVQAPVKQPQARRKSATAAEQSIKPAPPSRQQSTASIQSQGSATNASDAAMEEKKARAPRRRSASAKAPAASRRPSDLSASQRSAAAPVESPHSNKAILNANYGAAVAAHALAQPPTPTNTSGVAMPPNFGQFMGQLPVQQTGNMPLQPPPAQNMHQQYFPQPQTQQPGQQSSPTYMTQQQRQLALQQMMHQQQQRQQIAGSPRRTQQIFSPQGMQQMQQFYSPLNHGNAPSNRGQYPPSQAPMPPMSHMQRQMPMPQHPMGMNQGQPQMPVQPQASPQQKGPTQPPQQHPPPGQPYAQPPSQQGHSPHPPPQGQSQPQQGQPGPQQSPQHPQQQQ